MLLDFNSALNNNLIKLSLKKLFPNPIVLATCKPKGKYNNYSNRSNQTKKWE